MNSYKYLLFDCDDTVLDFSKAEDWSIRELLKEYNVPDTDENVKLYVDTNAKYWEIYERGEMTKQEILLKRFDEFFAYFKKTVDSEKVNIDYLTLLTKRVFVIDGIEELLKELVGKYRLFIISNGISWVQEARFKIAPITKYFEEIFVSESIGYQKPKPEFFKTVIDKIGDNDLSHYLVIGDSLTSDITGGNNAGIDTLWFNRKGKVGTIKPTYTITSVSEYKNIL